MTQLIFIDDSGDPGLRLGRGASEYFVIVAVIFCDEKSAEKASREIDRLREKLGWKKTREFKFRKSNQRIKDTFFNVVSRFDCALSIIILDKNNQDFLVFRKKPSEFYNTTILKTIKNFSKPIYNARFYIDGAGGKGYRHKVKAYFRQNFPPGTIKEIIYRDSNKDNLIQVADMIAGATRSKNKGDLAKIRHLIDNIESKL